MRKPFGRAVFAGSRRVTESLQKITNSYSFDFSLDFVANTIYFDVSHMRRCLLVAEKSRAEYYRKRRESRKQFMVLLDKELLERFDRKIKAEGKTRAEWLREKIAEELGE